MVKVNSKSKLKQSSISSKNSVRKKSSESNSKTTQEEGVSLDDAFGDDEDVVYAPPKPIKKKKVESLEEDELEEELDEIENDLGGEIEPVSEIKKSKPISKIVKGDRIIIDGRNFTVDAHFVLIDHGSTKEMTIELFDDNDKDYQLRYFSDQVDTTIEFYELQEIMYIKKRASKIEW